MTGRQDGAPLRVAVLGGGAFGRALGAAAARRGAQVTLWSRRLTEPPAPQVRIERDLAAVAEAELLLLAVPSPYVPDLSEQLAPYLGGEHLLVHVSRGLLGERLQTIGGLLTARTAVRRVGALAGPLSAEALSAGAPAAAILGTSFPEVAEAVGMALGGGPLRVEVTEDRCGVEVASALVGLMALAVGYVQRSGLSPATLSALLVRALQEARRLGEALGARPATFDGLAGVGDLLAAALGDERPEVRIGRALAAGASMEEAAAAAGGHVEGVRLAARLVAFARAEGIAAPLSEALAEAIEGRPGGWRTLAAVLDG